MTFDLTSWLLGFLISAGCTLIWLGLRAFADEPTDTHEDLAARESMLDGVERRFYENEGRRFR
jgi:hypothetical protein